MVTSRDVHEIVSKLSSDKAKPREEGIKLLNTWLEGERLIEFCRYLGRNTSMLKPHEIPHAETWPFLVKLLTKAIQLEVSASKKRPPKLAFAKTLRIVVQRAEDGKSLHLLSVAKLLFNHIWETLKDVPSFQSEYGIILRHLLAVKLQFHLRKRVYSSLVLLYMGKVEISLSEQRSYGQANPKEEVFRCILTLHSLLDSPPGDFSDDLREGITKGFIEIFSNLRDEGKVLRKLVECINTYLIRDGPNMGTQSLEIHDAIHQFLFRVWVTTHDRGLKDALVLYARLQLKLARGATDGSALLEQLLDIIGKELDHINTSTTSLPWNDTNRDDKRGTLTNSQSSLLELAAFVFCRACLIPCKAPVTDKRTRKENAVVYLHEQIIKGKWSWNSAFCFLVHDYSSRVKHEYLIYWFEGLSTNFERIMNAATMEHAYDDLLWTLRSLQGLSSVLLSPIYGVDCSGKVEFTNNQSDDKPPEQVKADLREYAASFKKLSGTGRKLSLDASCSGSNARERDTGMNEITSNTVRQSPIQEPKEDSKDMSFEYGKDHVLTAMNSDHDPYYKQPVISSDRDQYNKPPVISSKKLCLSSKNVQHEILESAVVHDLDAQKENLLKDQKKSFDGIGLTNPKRKKLGLTGKKPSIPFLGIPQNRKNDDKVSTLVSKLPRKPLQTLEGKHNHNMNLRVDDEVSDTNVSKNDEETLEQGLCEAEGVIVLDSEDSEEEKPVASKPRRLIARKRVLSKY